MPDPQIRAMWRTYFTPLDHRFRLEIINPVQTKVYKFAANVVARSIVGQSRSTIDPQAWVRDGAIVVVDVAKEQVGADIAAMLGGTLVNLVAIALGQQAALPTDRRRHVALLVARLPFASTRHLAVLSGEPTAALVYRCAARLLER